MGRKQNQTPQYNGEMWEQMYGENVQQYEKFCAYRDMRYIEPLPTSDVPRLDITKSRSLRNLAKSLSISHKALEPLSAKFRWVERCEEYDSYILQLLRAKNEAEIIRMKEKHATIAAQMLRKATQRLLTIKDKDIEASDIVRLVDVGVKIERLSRGESTENQKISGETNVHHSGTVNIKPTDHLDLSSLSDEELEQLEQLLGKLHQEPGI